MLKFLKILLLRSDVSQESFSKIDFDTLFDVRTKKLQWQAIFSLVSQSPRELIELNETGIFLVVFFAKNEDNKVRLCGKVWKGLLTSNQTMT